MDKQIELYVPFDIENGDGDCIKNLDGSRKNNCDVYKKKLANSSISTTTSCDSFSVTALGTFICFSHLRLVLHHSW